MLIHELIVSDCAGCNRITGDICPSYLKPASRHRVCICPLRSTGKIIYMDEKSRKKMNPLKASKRRMRG